MAANKFKLKQLAQDGATTNQIIQWDGGTWVPSSIIIPPVVDADYGDITVTSSGTSWTINPGKGGIYSGSGIVSGNTEADITVNILKI